MTEADAAPHIISVLYVDDEPGLPELVTTFIEMSGGFKVIACEGAMEALEMMSCMDIDVIVSDYQMPSMDGIQFLKHLRSSGNTTPFIIFTGKGREEVVIEAFDSGADFYVMKGGDVSTQLGELSGKIRNAFMRRRTEDTVQKQIRAMEASIDGMALVDEDQNHAYINSAYLRMFGFDDPNELLGSSWRVLYDEEEARRFDDEESMGLYERRYFMGLATGRRKDGSYFPIELTLTMLSDDSIISVVRDMTDYVRVEKERDTYASNLQTLFDSINEMIFIMSEDCRILECNDTVMRKTGYSRDELMKKSMVDLLESGHREEAKRILDSILGGDENVCDIPLVTKDGVNVQTETNISRGTWNNVEVLIGVSRDKLHRLRLENALRQANKKLSLLSSITRHDILNQLMVLQGYLQIIMDKAGDSEPKDELKKIESAARLIQKDIEFTKSYEKLGLEDPSWHSISYLLGLVDCQGKIEIVDECKGLSVLADPMLIKVFNNLMDNTIQHGDGATKVRVSYELMGDGCNLIWEDDGKGVPPDMKQSLFQRGRGKNHGFGLFLSEKILKITDISIKENGNSSGAKFVMTIPKGAWHLA